MQRTKILQAIRLRGFVTLPQLVEMLAGSPSQVEAAVADLEREGQLEVGPRGLRLTAEGRVLLEQELEQERTTADTAALESLYKEFEPLNAEFKRLITDWQLRSHEGGADPVVNDHADPDYDKAVIDRLLGLHGRFESLNATAATLLPRLGGYWKRFESARDRIVEGEHRFVAAPLIDSYHTIWFELHEELIQATRRSRKQEASSGGAD